MNKIRSVAMVAAILYVLIGVSEAYFKPSMLVWKQCFQLSVFYDCVDVDEYEQCLHGQFFYDLKSKDDVIEVDLKCPYEHQFVEVIYAEYALPFFRDEYCLGINASCTSSEPCTCCTEPDLPTNLCYQRASLNTALVNRCRRENHCKLKFREKLFSKRNCPQLNYRCDLGGMDNNWCSSRWVHVYYDCVATPPAILENKQSTSTTTIPTQPPRANTTTLPAIFSTTIIQPAAKSDVNALFQKETTSHAIPIISFTYQKSGSRRRMAVHPENSSTVAPSRNRALPAASPGATQERGESNTDGFIFGIFGIISAVVVCTVAVCVVLLFLFVRKTCGNATEKQTRKTRRKNSHLGSITSESSYQKVTIV